MEQHSKFHTSHGKRADLEVFGRAMAKVRHLPNVKTQKYARLAHHMHGDFDMNTPQHVLVGYDGSAFSELALHRAFRMVEHAAFAIVHVVAVVDEGAGDYVRLPSGELMSRWAALDSVRLMVAGISEDLRARNAHVRVIAHLRMGEIAPSLVDFAYRFHIDQIVVGARGQGTRSETCIGSVATKLIDLTEIPVHLESPVSSMPSTGQGEAMRWAHISGSNSDQPEGYLTHSKVRALA